MIGLGELALLLAVVAFGLGYRWAKQGDEDNDCEIDR